MSGLEQAIRGSDWWRRAEETHDRHHPDDQPVNVTDHLVAVQRTAQALLREERLPSFSMALAASGVDLSAAPDMLETAALLHDIGKPVEYANRDDPPALEDGQRPPRHPEISAGAARELLPEDLPHRAAIIALVEQHDTPYSWYRQSLRGAAVPKQKAWEKLGRKIWPDPCVGIALLAAFKLCDVDGHDDVTDVVWFIENANASLLAKRGRALPVPTADEIRGLASGA
jgi:putative nucleotidyltransferase with HDIG domain